MWALLLLGAACLLGYMLLFADSAERALVQCVLITMVTVFIVTPLLLIEFLDHPYRDRTGSIMPASMQFTLEAMEHERRSTEPVPCTPEGAPAQPQAHRRVQSQVAYGRERSIRAHTGSSVLTSLR
jgi:hypothetical protein